MERTRSAGRLAETGGWEGGLHAAGIPAKQRLHLAALLIAVAVVVASALPLQAQSEDGIAFDPTITQQQFSDFSRIIGQSIYASPVDPARATSFLGFDIGVAATGVQVDTSADYWQAATNSDLTIGNYIGVPRVIVRKGFSMITLSASYAAVPDLDVQVWGAAIDVPIIDGGVLKPTLAVRGVYSSLRGIDVYENNAYGAELFLSKGFGPVTPYGAIGRMRVDATGTINAAGLTLHDEADMTRITLGVRLSLLIPKLVIEATQAEERSYSAKVSFGL